LEEGSCTDNMTCTGGCRYGLMYSWWWVWKAPETCSVTLQWNKIDCEQLHIVGLLQYGIIYVTFAEYNCKHTNFVTWTVLLNYLLKFLGNFVLQ